MREDDKPRDLAVRDTLFDKIKGSTSMAFDIRYYRSMREGQKDKTYEYLMDMMARTIATEREEKNRLDQAKGIRELLGAKAFPVEKPPKKDDNKSNKNKEGSEAAAPALPKPNPKAHSQKGGKRKDRGGKGKDKNRRDRSSDHPRPPSQDRKSRPCVYHFQKGRCSKGKDCPYSHAKKHAPRASSANPGKGRNPSRNDRSSSPKPKSDHVSCLRKGKVKDQIVHASMTAVQRQQRRDRPKPKHF